MPGTANEPRGGAPDSEQRAQPAASTLLNGAGLERAGSSPCPPSTRLTGSRVSVLSTVTALTGRGRLTVSETAWNLSRALEAPGPKELEQTHAGRTAGCSRANRPVPQPNGPAEGRTRSKTKSAVGRANRAWQERPGNRGTPHGRSQPSPVNVHVPAPPDPVAPLLGLGVQHGVQVVVVEDHRVGLHQAHARGAAVSGQEGTENPPVSVETPHQLLRRHEPLA